MKSRFSIPLYVIGDLISASLSWILFYGVRKIVLHHDLSLSNIFYYGLILLTPGWLILYHLVGTYRNIYTKSRLAELFLTLMSTLLGILLLFIIYLSVVTNPLFDPRQFFLLFAIHFLLTFLVRIIFLTIAHNQLQSGKVFFNTLLIGGDKTAIGLYESLISNKEKTGFRLCGYINITVNQNSILSSYLKDLGPFENMEAVIDSNKIEEVIIAVEKNERSGLEKILQRLSEKEVNVKMIADNVDILTGAVRTTNVMGVPLIELHTGLMPAWQQNVKRLIDVAVSLLGMIVLSPLFLFSALRVKLSSPGSVFFSQERIGYKGKRFVIYKFRSMFQHGELNGPLLSSDNDARITAWGKVMRRWRLDELPQLWNIFSGEMSLVGPRPPLLSEVQRYEWLYRKRLSIKPGITCIWQISGRNEVSFKQWMEMDRYYIENWSLWLDIQILAKTVPVVLLRKGAS